jgi:hypothetical protein
LHPKDQNYDFNVFINCPFDDEYASIMEAMIFTIIDCGFIPMTAKDLTANGDERLKNIFKLINDSKYLINDISKIETDKKTKLPRFNMPIELGICIGAREYGDDYHKEKNLLLLENKQFESKKYASDLSGIDCRYHNNDYKKAIHCIRDWLNNFVDGKILPGGDHIENKYEEFLEKLPSIAKRLHQTASKLTHRDKLYIMNEYLKEMDSIE